MFIYVYINTFIEQKQAFLINRMSYKYSEKSSAKNHLDYARNILPQKSRMICIFDRRYPSIELINQMLESNQYFVFRLKANDFKREYEKLRDDEDNKRRDAI